MRLSAMAIVVLSLVGALTARLWFLTAVEGENAAQAAEANRIRTIHIQAPRGRIFDRNYSILVDNQQVRQLRIDSEELNEATGYDEDERNVVFGRVADALTLYQVPHEDEVAPPGAAPLPVTPWTAADVDDAYQHNADGPFLPIPVADGVPEELEVLLAENHMEYPGIDVEPVAVRSYPHGTLAAHLLGYVKPLDADELQTDAVANETDKPYAPGDDIGKSGVERSYERYLRGTPGTRVIEVDAENNVVRTVRYDPPVPGDDVMLAMDIRVQAILEAKLAAQAHDHSSPGASGVVMDPGDGSVIAMASYPTFNPAELSGRVSQARYNELIGVHEEPDGTLTDLDNGAPLNNKAISGEYLPGSTFKVVTALAALRNGLTTPETPWNDTGTYTVAGCTGSSCEFQNAGGEPTSATSLPSAITQSSDTYFYHLGDQLWGARDAIGDDALQQVAHEFGVAEDTNIDLPSASDGFIWTPEILADLYAEHPDEFMTGDWVPGDSVNMAIGQGYLGVTPVQLTNIYAAIGNGGTLHTPHVVRQILRPRTPDHCPPDNPDGCWDPVVDFTTDPPDDLGTVDIPAPWRSAMMQGLLGVPTVGPLGTGTAHNEFEGFDLANYPIAGKTGTAQKNDEEDYGLFVGMGPVRPEAPPDYVVSSIFEDSGAFGATIAAPVARSIFDGVSHPNDPLLMPAVPNSRTATPVGSTAQGDVAVEAAG
jgi:penicillin-binding protein 2